MSVIVACILISHVAICDTWRGLFADISFLSQVQESLLQSYKTLTDKNIMGARFKVTQADVVQKGETCQA